MVAILERVGRGETVDHLETVRVRRDGAPLQMSLTISPIKDADNAIVGASMIARDIGERKAAEALAAAHDAEVEENRAKSEQLRLARELASHDPLTGILNRRSSTEAIERYMRLSERHGQPLSLAVLDIDHFKQINDNHGHLLGDAVLLRLAELMTETFRSEDVLSRWGGDEFMIAMYGTSRDDGARRVGDLLEAFAAASISDGHAKLSGITCTAGVAQYRPGGQNDLQTLYRSAGPSSHHRKIRVPGTGSPRPGAPGRWPLIHWVETHQRQPAARGSNRRQGGALQTLAGAPAPRRRRHCSGRRIGSSET